MLGASPAFGEVPIYRHWRAFFVPASLSSSFLVRSFVLFVSFISHLILFLGKWGADILHIDALLFVYFL